MPSPNQCPECGAPLPEGGTCMHLFHNLLYLEHEVAPVVGDRGYAAHFHSVSAYVLQHPDSMRYTAGALADLRRTVADHLAGRATLSDVRSQVRGAADGPVRITRREGDPVVQWPVKTWPLTVADVVTGGVEGYCDRAAAWATATLRALDEAHA